MKSRNTARIATAAVALLVMVSATGCKAWRLFYQHPTVSPLGALSDPVWQMQETNAEMSDFVVHQHEFEKDTEYLNTDGEDHIKQIAARLGQGQDAYVVVERGRFSPRADTQYGYPVHPNPELDMRRREILVRSLAALGVVDADQRVVVAPAYAPGFKGYEAEAAYGSAMGGGGRSGGYGSGFGGFFFGGGGGRF